MDFPDFVKFLLTFVMLEKQQLYKVAFNYIDKDKGGDLDKEELEEAIEDLHSTAPEYRRKHIHNSIGKYFKSKLGTSWDHDVAVDFRSFSEMMTAMPQLLYPIFWMHEMLQRKTLGVRYFENRKLEWMKERKVYQKEVAERQSREKKELKALKEKAGKKLLAEQVYKQLVAGQEINETKVPKDVLARAKMRLEKHQQKKEQLAAERAKAVKKREKMARERRERMAR